MEIIVKPTIDNIESYIHHHIHNFLLPLDKYAVEYTNYYNLEQIKKIRNEYPDINLFISINKNILNRDIDDLKTILLELEHLNIKGIFYYDLALLQLKKELNLKTDLVWNQTFMVTNYKTCDYYHSKGVKYALLAKEITKDEIIEINTKSKIIPIVELISYPTTAFSRRKLIKNYCQDSNLESMNSIQIVEPKTKQKYTLVEDDNGVSFVMKKLMNGSKILKPLLENHIEYILLKEDFIDHEIFLECIDNINYLIHHYSKISKLEYKNWLNKQNKLLGRNTNFFYRKTIYKVK